MTSWESPTKIKGTNKKKCKNCLSIEQLFVPCSTNKTQQIRAYKKVNFFLYDHKNSFTLFKLTSACIISILCISYSPDKENLFNSYKLFPSTSQLSSLLSSSLAKFFSAYFPSDFNISHLSQAHIFSHISWISSLLGEFTTSIPSTSSINFASCKQKSWI